MRIALISDIHGNYISLEAVLAQIKRDRVDQIICLGDVADFGPQPLEVIARLRDLGCPCIMGNHEFLLLNSDFPKDEATLAPEREMSKWCAEQLSEDDLEYLRTFQPGIEIPLGSHNTLLCFHGSPRSNNEHILSTTPAQKLEEMISGHKGTVLAGGHTHTQMLRQHMGRLIVNVGSVGSPVEQFPVPPSGPRFLPWGEYSIVSWTDGALGVELRRVPIDLDKIRGAILSSKIPFAELSVSRWLDPGF